MRFASTSTALTLILPGGMGSLRLGAEEQTIHEGCGALFGMTVGDHGTEKSKIGRNSTTVFTHSLEPTDEGLDVIVAAESWQPGAAGSCREKRLFAVYHCRKVSARE